MKTPARVLNLILQARIRTIVLVPICILVYILASRTCDRPVAQPDPKRAYNFINTVSQFNEIGALIALGFESTVASKFVVDVGARGKFLSNSYDLLNALHWKGILIDAHPKSIEDITREFAGLDAEIIHTAVSDYEGTASFTLSQEPDHSSLVSDWTNRFGGPKGSVTVPVQRLPNILKARNVPKNFGVLSIDVEGHDVKVLNDLFTRSDYRPEYIIIETLDAVKLNSLDEIPVVPEVRSSYFELGRTEANLILKRKK